MTGLNGLPAAQRAGASLSIGTHLPTVDGRACISAYLATTTGGKARF